MKINLEKSKVVKVSRDGNVNIQIDGKQLQYVQHLEYLEVIISSDERVN